MTGDAFTFVAPEEESDLRAIERAIGKRLPRVTVPGFDYRAAPAERLEVPLAERIAAIRARKAQDRARAKEKAVRRITNAAGAGASRPPASRPPAPRPHASSSRPHDSRPPAPRPHARIVHTSRPQGSQPDHDSRPIALRPMVSARPKADERPSGTRWGRRS
jgi:ATP-dependent RNA helicase RhlE